MSSTRIWRIYKAPLYQKILDMERNRKILRRKKSTNQNQPRTDSKIVFISLEVCKLVLLRA